MDKGHKSLVLEHLNKGRGAGPVINPWGPAAKIITFSDVNQHVELHGKL